jgi:plastocyanin
MLTRILGMATVVLLVGASAATAQKSYPIRLRHPSADVYLFEPARVTARPGDRLEFTVEGGGPYVIGFEPADLDAREQALLDAAMPERTAPLRSPVLPRPGSRFELTVPALPKGSYRFTAVTHIAYQMSGVLVVP